MERADEGFMRPAVTLRLGVTLACSALAALLVLPSCVSAPVPVDEDAITDDEVATLAEDIEDADIAEIEIDDAAANLDDEGAAPEGSEPTGAALAASMDAYLTANFSRVDMPGAAIAVVDADGVRYLSTLGDCSGADTLFIVGSLSKSFTAVAIMQLVEQGLVDLDAPAVRYAASYDVPTEVTVRSLLNQTSGFGSNDSLDEAANGQLGDTFGTFSYANANYDLLGRVVEGVSGESYARYLDEHVLELIGMTSSTADLARAAEFGLAPGHRDWFGLHLADGFQHAQGDDAWGGPSSGYVAASVQDMAAYLRMYLNDGVADDNTSVLAADSVQSMFLDRVPDPAGDTYYGMGWTSFYWDDGELVLSHDGQVENYVASMCLLPDRGIGVVVLADANDNAGGNNRFFDLVNGVVSVAIGGSPAPVDVGWTAVWRQRTDVLYACAVLASAAPLLLLLLGRWRRRLRTAPRRRLLVQGVALHAVLPAMLLVLPFLWEKPWRDLLSFSPDVSLVLVTCAVLLVVAGMAKLAAAVWWRGSRRLPDGEPPGSRVCETPSLRPRTCDKIAPLL